MDPQLFANTVDSAPDGIVVVDAGGMIVFANRMTETILGYTPDELVGKPVEMVVPDRVRGRHMSHQAAYHAYPSARPMGTGLDLSALRRDGTELPVEISLSPIRTDEGTYVAAIIRDISVRKAQEEVRRRAEERYRLLAEQARDIIYRIRLMPAPPRVEYMSPASFALTGYSPEAHYADPALLLHMTNEEHRPVLAQVLAAPDSMPDTMLLETTHRDGHTLWLEHQFTVVRDERGQPIAIEGIARDTTARVLLEQERVRMRAETELQIDRERIGRDLHDGVMQALYGIGLNLLDIRHRDSTFSSEAARRIDETISSLNEVIADIRQFVLNLPLDRTAGELGALLRGLVDELRDEAAMNVSLQLAPDLPDLTDEQRVVVFFVTQEALTNARRHAQAKTVTVRAEHTPSGVLIEIIDDGAGFAVSEERGIEHMGLRNMHARAAQVRGQLEIESSPDGGTSIRLVLPIDLNRVTASAVAVQ